MVDKQAPPKPRASVAPWPSPFAGFRDRSKQAVFGQQIQDPLFFRRMIR